MPARGASGACPPHALAIMAVISVVRSARAARTRPSWLVTARASTGPMDDAATRGGATLLGWPWESDLEPHPQAPTARNGLVLAMESPLSPLQQLAAAGVGWARPTAGWRLGGASSLVPRRSDAAPARAQLLLRRSNDPPRVPRGTGWWPSNRLMSVASLAVLAEDGRSLYLGSATVEAGPARADARSTVPMLMHAPVVEALWHMPLLAPMAWLTVLAGGAPCTRALGAPCECGWAALVMETPR